MLQLVVEPLLQEIAHKNIIPIYLETLVIILLGEQMQLNFLLKQGLKTGVKMIKINKICCFKTLMFYH